MEYLGLILCHPKQCYVKDKIICNHYFGNILSETSLDFTGFIFKTIDLKNSYDDCPSYIDDCFSDNFINNHLHEYDLLIAPDCGGKWYTLQESHNLKEFGILINSLIKLLKENSIIILDKFIFPEFKKLTIKILEDNMFQLENIETGTFIMGIR